MDVRELVGLRVYEECCYRDAPGVYKNYRWGLFEMTNLPPS